jgi:hypothetical protein
MADKASGPPHVVPLAPQTVATCKRERETVDTCFRR